MQLKIKKLKNNITKISNQVIFLKKQVKYL